MMASLFIRTVLIRPLTLLRGGCTSQFYPRATQLTCHLSNLAGGPGLQRPSLPSPAWASLHFQCPVSPRPAILHRTAALYPNLVLQPIRKLTYFSLKKGKKKTVKSVVKRFLRLHCGLWLRRKAGYKKKLWKKSSVRKHRLREHVFCNGTQSKLLDKMTTSFWKRRNWYINDPYQKYHDRTNLKV